MMVPFRARKTSYWSFFEEGFGSRERGVLGTGCRARIVVRDRLLQGSWCIGEVVLEPIQ
jgi:hypothetical protein